MIRWIAGGLGSHLAKCFILRTHHRWIKNTLQVTFFDSESYGKLTSFNTMALANHFVTPPLLHGVCPPQTAEPCSRTATGSCCLILPCQDFGNGFHFSHSCHCLLDCGSPTPALAHRHLHSNSFAVNSAMARLRHRMHSRPGGSRGGFTARELLPVPPLTPRTQLLNCPTRSLTPLIPNPIPEVGEVGGTMLSTLWISHSLLFPALTAHKFISTVH